MPMSAEDIERLIVDALPDAKVKVTDLRGDSDHYAAQVESAAFAGKPLLQQHRMVYDALYVRGGNTLHALSLTTVVPDQQA